MTFQSVQESAAGGKPILLFEFTDMTRTWRYTDQAKPIVKDSETFEPAIISMDMPSQSLGEGPQGFQVRVVSDCPIAVEFKPYLPPRPIFMRAFTQHRTDVGAEWIVPCMGEVASGHFGEDGFTTLQVSPSLYKGKRVIPWPMYSATCNWAVYSVGCGLDREDFRTDGEIDTVDFMEITSAALATKPDGYFRAGFMIRVLTGEYRFIVAHTGSAATLAAPIVGMAVGEDVVFFAGCDGLEGTCDTKFDNLPRFFGFPDLPTRNPFTDNVFGTGNAAAGQSNKSKKGLLGSLLSRRRT